MRKGIVDLDNCVSDWVGWVAKTHGMPVVDPDAYSVEEMFGMSKKEAARFVSLPGGYGSDSLRKIPHASAVLNAINKTYFISYLSAAPKEFLDRRMLWMIQEGYPLGRNASIRHTGDQEEKIERILEKDSDASFIVDDVPVYLHAAYVAGVPLRFLYTQPHNRRYINTYVDGFDFIRVFGWHEIKAVLDDIDMQEGVV
jgi:hypothetical protein